MSVLSAEQLRSKYGLTGLSIPSDPGSGFALAKAAPAKRVLPYTAATRDTTGMRTAWENQNPGAGPGSLQNWNTGSSLPMLPSSIGE